MAIEETVKAKPFLFVMIAVGLGCAYRQRELVLDAVGPCHLESRTVEAGGTLVVYSARDPFPHFNSSPYHDYHSDYRILSNKGATLKNVHNDSDTVVEGPVEVKLKAGTYLVRARANGYGWVTVPVVIEAGRGTKVHLDGGAGGLRNETPLPKDGVRLPHGEIAGWRASTDRTDNLKLTDAGY